jgi:hypothetical protein
MLHRNRTRIAKERKAGTKYAQLCDRIKTNNLAPSDVAALLKKEGFTAGSAASTASYLMNVSKPENAKTLRSFGQRDCAQRQKAAGEETDQSCQV